MAVPYPGFARMLGVVVVNSTVYFLVDGRPMWRLDFNETPVLYLGPLQYTLDMDTMMPGACITGFVPPFYLASGSARIWLFLGNESPPSPEGPYGPLYIPPAVAATSTDFYATSRVSRYTLNLVGPPPYICTSELKCKWGAPLATIHPDMGVNAWNYYGVRIPVYINGTLRYVPFGFVLNGDWLAYGDVAETPAGAMAVGPAWFWPAHLPISIRLPNGSAVAIKTPIFKPFNYTPPQYVYFKNGTRLTEPRPIYIANVTRPAVVEAEYSYRQCYVVINAPGNKAEGWHDAGSTLAITPIVDFGNGTRLVSPLVNGSRPPLSAVADRPLRFYITYAREHLVRVASPVNNTEVWLPEGFLAYITAPEVADLSNGTRLLSPSAGGRGLPLVVKVERPVEIRVEYSERQYLVRIGGVAPREFWAEPGSYVAPERFERGGVVFMPVGLVVNSSLVPIAAVRGPVEARAVYKAVAVVDVGFALYANARLKCGDATASRAGFLADRLYLELYDPPTVDCQVEKLEIPPWIVAIIVAALAAAVFLRRKF